MKRIGLPGEPLRILHVIDGLGVGGAEVQLVRMLQHLPRAQFEHAIGHVGPRYELAEPARALGVAVVDLSRHGRRSMVHALAALGRLARAFRPGLVHTDGLYSNPLGRLVGALAGIPVLTTVGNTVLPPGQRRPFPRTRRQALRFLLSFVNRRTVRGSRHFLAISEAVRRSMLQALPISPERITVVYRGVELDHWVPRPAEQIARLRAALAPPDVQPLLLTVGRLTTQKGQEFLIRALPLVRHDLPRVHLVMAGEGPLESHLRAVAAACGVADAVTFLGRRADVPELLQCADLFVFPSLYEGLGGAMLEAMAMRRPIVASSIPALAEAADGSACLVPPRDPVRLAEGIVHLASRTELWGPMGERARRAVEERFDLRRNALAFGRLCRRVAGWPEAPAARRGALSRAAGGEPLQVDR